MDSNFCHNVEYIGNQLKKAKIFYSFTECDKEIQRLKLLQRQHQLCPEVIPLELAGLYQWVVWSYEVHRWKNGMFGVGKVPYQAKIPNEKASRTTSLDWCDLETAVRCVKNDWYHVDGIGFVFSRADGLSGVDFDNCRDPLTGRIREEYQFWVDALGGYAEVSPSGTGVKVWVKGTISDRYFKTEESTGFRILNFAGGEIEVYRRGQYFTVTTQYLKKVGSITSAQRELDVLSEWSLSEVNRDLSDDYWLSAPIPTVEGAVHELSLPENSDGTSVESTENLGMQPTSSTHSSGAVDIHTPSTLPSTTPHPTDPRCSECGMACDPQYELCSECYKVSPNRETKVEDVVYAYFSKLKVKGFSAYQQNNPEEKFKCKIQFGSRNGYADVVLVNKNDSFAAIAECKGARYEGDGVEQLKSYLSATDTRFGIFANDINSDGWQFYENQRNNQFSPIDCSGFEAGVVERIDRRVLLVDEIQELEARQAELQSKVEGLEQDKHELKNSLRKLNVIIENEHTQLSELKKQWSKQFASLHVYRQRTGVRIKLEEQGRERLASLNKQIQQLEIHKSKQQTETHTLTQTKGKQHAACGQLKVEADQVGTRKSELEIKVARLEQKEHDLNTTCKRLKEEINQLTKQKSDLKRKIGIKRFMNWLKNLFSKENE
jgi:predicted  nucleic acid-binding Zn-ribbon protein